jgi:hypothetical protein
MPCVCKRFFCSQKCSDRLKDLPASYWVVAEGSYPRRVKRLGHESNAEVKKACTCTSTLTYTFETCKGTTTPPSAFTFLQSVQTIHRPIECDFCERRSGERVGHFCHEVRLVHNAFVNCLYERDVWKNHCVVVCVYQVQVQFTLEQASEAHGGSRGITLPFFNLGARWGGWSTPRPGRFTPRKDPVPICLCVYIYIYVCVCVYIRVSIYIYIYIHTQTHVWTFSGTQ